jgi:hypothetical protein
MIIVKQDDDAAEFLNELRGYVYGLTKFCQPAELFLIKTNT